VQGFVPYDMTHVVTQSQLLFYSALAFVFLQKFGLYPPELPSTNVDAEWIYRKGGPRLVKATWTVCARVGGICRRSLFAAVDQNLSLIKRLHSPQHGALGEPWSIGTAALWAAGMLAAFALLGLL
jgi:multicomponent Na+:H+ antiporter subunit D